MTADGLHYKHLARHGGTVPVPVEALLASDPELWLVWAPLHESCRGGCDGVCVCDDAPAYCACGHLANQHLYFEPHACFEDGCGCQGFEARWMP